MTAVARGSRVMVPSLSNAHASGPIAANSGDSRSSPWAAVRGSVKVSNPWNAEAEREVAARCGAGGADRRVAARAGRSRL
jgi:hypothetical protein